MATITLSASQLQSRLQALSASNTPLTVWQIERIRQAWGSQQRLVTNYRDEVDTLYASMIEVQARLDNIENELQGIQSACTRAANELGFKLKLYEPLLVPDNIAEMDNQQQSAIFDDIIAKLKDKLQPETWDRVNELHLAFGATLKSKAFAEGYLVRTNAEAVDARNNLERVEDMLKAAETKLATILDPDNKLDAADEARVYDLISEFSFIETFALGSLHKFSVLPSDFLIIVLVVTMGVLGSTMQLTYDYYRGADVGSPSLFILRPMLGAITALVVFILLRAGVLVVTDSSNLGDTVPLNPFFIAFVGIVSGLLSENALETVRRVGSTWLTSSAPDAEARWAVGVAAHLSETKTLENLAAKTGIDAAELKEWVEQKKPTPAAMQQVLAAWLDVEVQSLFTDLPPRPATS